MNIKCINIYIVASALLLTIGCKTPAIAPLAEKKPLPVAFDKSKDTINSGTIAWRKFFTDKNLVSLIDIAIANNQELQIILQEIEISKNEIRIKKGELLPSVGLGLGTGVEKVGRYSSQGAGDATTEITPGKEFPDPLTDFKLGAYAHWEVDVWKKLRNSKKAAVNRYLASIEGKNFAITNLIGEVASSYYELVALDNQLEIVKQNIDLQSNALEIVKIQKEAAKATELAVQKFQAEVYNSKSKEFEILQMIKETENKINFLLGRFPQEIPREKSNFVGLAPTLVNTGIPSQMLDNRPDIKQAELELTAAKLDVKVAKAAFYPTLDIGAGLGLNAFKTSFLTKFPESLFYSLVGDLAGPLINRNAIKAEFKNANSKQIQALINYDKTVLNAYLEISNQLSKINNIEKSYNLKSKRVDALTKSIEVSNDLFKSARVDYFEVLMTQRDALESKLELIETKKEQLNTMVSIYRSLGGGWK